MTFRGIISSTRLKGETRGMTVASQERSGEDLLPLCFSVCMLAAGIYFRTSFASYSRRRTPSKLLSSKPPISGNIAIKLEEGSQRAPTTKPRPPRQTSYGATDRHSGFRTRGPTAVEDSDGHGPFRDMSSLLCHSVHKSKKSMFIKWLHRPTCAL